MVDKENLKTSLVLATLIFCLLLFSYKVYSKFDENWTRFYDEATSLLPLNTSESLEELRNVKGTYYTGQTYLTYSCFVDRDYSKQSNAGEQYYKFIGAYGNIKNDVRFLVYYHVRKDKMCYQVHDKDYFSKKMCFSNAEQQERVSFIKSVVEFCFLNSRGSGYFYF